MSDFFGKTTTATGATAINHSHVLATSSYTITLHLSAAPTTSGNLTVTVDSTSGAAYDTLLYSRDLAAAPAITDLVLTDIESVFTAGDTLVVAYANADGRTYGLQITSGKVN